MTRAAGYPTIIAGDFILRDDDSPSIRDCAPKNFTRQGDDRVQHIYASDDLTFTGTTRIDMTGTTTPACWPS